MSFENTHSESLGRMCLDKNRYPDKKTATTFLNRWRKVRGRHGRPEALRAYHCPHCNGWHVTKGRPMKFQPVRTSTKKKGKIF